MLTSMPKSHVLKPESDLQVNANGRRACTYVPFTRQQERRPRLVLNPSSQAERFRGAVWGATDVVYAGTPWDTQVQVHPPQAPTRATACDTLGHVGTLATSASQAEG